MDMLNRLLSRYPDLHSCAEDVVSAYRMLENCYQQGGKVLVCGNGGSAADSEHITGELLKGFYLKRPIAVELRQKLAELWPNEGKYLADHLQGALPAISLVSQVSFITAFANDVAADMIFAQQVFAYGQAGDVLLALSTSGNAKNVVNAVKVASAKGIRSLSLTGKTGGILGHVSDVTIKVGWELTPDIQERHQAIYHTLCAMLEERFFA